MKELILAMSALNVMFLFMHEFDASHKGEWRMLRFLRVFKDETQYLIFLYAHIPITLFLFYYLWTVYNYNNFILWIIINALSVAHLIIHLVALKWDSNVIKPGNSFFIVIGYAITGLAGLLLVNYY
jgi:hypothetical protein